MRVGGQEYLPYCCGVDDVGGWDYRTDEWRPRLEKSGTGLFTASFIDNEDNREAYEELCKKHKLLYQSPVKENENSGNDLFLCVFQYKAPRRRRERLPQL